MNHTVVVTAEFERLPNNFNRVRLFEDVDELGPWCFREYMTLETFEESAAYISGLYAGVELVEVTK